MVASESTARVMRATSRSLPSLVASRTSVARSRSSPSPAAARPSTSADGGAREAAGAGGCLASRQGGALVGLHVGPQPGTRQGRRESAQVGSEDRGVDQQRGSLELAQGHCILQEQEGSHRGGAARVARLGGRE